ncbi:hypothetical protein KIL84_022692 [Mauremys mutica]|uniref:Uncharacterized protein n=1 Tax=Mauremys mutica TaxID=74926 RepID=A0A9D4AP06_9SAUR|nr:hypothetical protein KIL84_022692 [Mauremys mutica]
MKYELAPVPLSLSNLDGSLGKTQKSNTLSWLEKNLSVVEIPASNESAFTIIDLMMLLQMVCTDSAKCKIFGELSDQLLNIILGCKCQYTGGVGDSYANKESIKSGAIACRGNVQMQEVWNPTMLTPLPKQ